MPTDAGTRHVVYQFSGALDHGNARLALSGQTVAIPPRSSSAVLQRLAIPDSLAGVIEKQLARLPAEMQSLLVRL